MGYTSYVDYIEKSRTHETPFALANFSLDVNGERVGIELPANYAELVDRIAGVAKRKIANGEFTDDTFMLKLNGMLDVAEVRELGEHFASEMSNKLYGTEVLIEHLHTYQNKITASEESSSWKWHYDNCAPGQIKILLYLTPTTRETGAFLTMSSPNGFCSFESSRKSPTRESKPKFPGSRIPPEVIDSLKNDGYNEFYIEGDPGTFVLFSQNTIHKATIPRKKPERICLIYNFRPYHEQLERHIGRGLTHEWEYTGSVKIYQYDLAEKASGPGVRARAVAMLSPIARLLSR